MRCRDMLALCASCDELAAPLRRTEKRFLNNLNTQVRFPPPKKSIVRTPADKVQIVRKPAAMQPAPAQTRCER